MRKFSYRFITCLSITSVLALVSIYDVRSHEIPNDVAIQSYLKPEGNQLSFVVRVPLRAMQDIDYPRKPTRHVDMSRVESSLRDAATMWISDNIAIFENDRHLGNPVGVEARISLESDPSFASYESAVQHIRGERLPDTLDLYWEQGLLDVAFAYPIESDSSEFSVRPEFERLGLRVLTVIRFIPPNGSLRAFELHGNPGLIRLDPRWHQAALRFVESGFYHILEGIDHLLFLFCLVIPYRKFKSLIGVVTAFTIAHSITLIASAFNLAPDALWFPPLIETLIAVSIVYMAIENIVRKNFEHRWVIAFGFGLVHGFGFSFALRESLQFAGDHLLISLLSFNLGVELGQLLVLALIVPALILVFRHALAERIGTIILSVIVAHTAWHWMIDRGSQLSEFSAPELNASTIAMFMRWMMAIIALSSLVWVVSLLQKKWRKKATPAHWQPSELKSEINQEVR